MLDAPLLFETKFLEFVTGPIVVVFTGDKVKQRQRLMDRNKISAKDAQTKIDAQLPIAEKVKKADILIDNSGSLEDLKLLITEKTIPAIIKRL